MHSPSSGQHEEVGVEPGAQVGVAAVRHHPRYEKMLGGFDNPLPLNLHLV